MYGPWFFGKPLQVTRQKQGLMNILTTPACQLCYLYFLQGLPYGLQARFLPIYFRVHGMSLTNIGFTKVLFFPWLCKTLWAPFVDRHGNKKLWLTWSMVGLGMTCVAAACIQPDWLLSLGIILLIFNFLTSTQDIATDGLAIEILTSSQVASGNIAQVVGYKCGAIVGGGFLAWLSDYISWGTIFVFLTIVYVMAVGVIRHLEIGGRVYSFNVPKPERPAGKGSVPDGGAGIMHQEKAAGDAVNMKNISPGTKTMISQLRNSDVTDLASQHLDTFRPQQTASADDSVSQPLTISSSHCTLSSAGKSGSTWWIKDHFADVLQTEGTIWILLFVLVYKLGEQGALNMMPMFLIDHGMSAAELGLWTGIVGQALSIAGSVAGGAVITSSRYTALGCLWRLSILKISVLAAEMCTIAYLAGHAGSLGVGTGVCVVLMQLLLTVSGAVSTAAFTLMMMCSQRANPHCQASHYSLLATLEVLGKLMFSVFVGVITDAVGYPFAFVLFFLLSLMTLPFFNHAPQVLMQSSHSSDNSFNKIN